MSKTNDDKLAAHRRHRNFLIIGIIGMLVLLGGVVGAWFWLGQEKPPQDLIKDAITVTDEADEKVTISSQLGFTLTFDKSFLDVYAQVTTSVENGNIKGLEFDGDDLKTPRSYSIVTMHLKDETSTEQGLSFTRPQMRVLTSSRKEYFESRRAQNPSLSDAEITVKAFAPTDSHLTGREQEVINNVTYEKLLYERRSASSGAAVGFTLQYITVQHNRPYVVDISYYPRTQQGDLTPFMQALNSLAYPGPDGAAQYLSGTQPEKQPAQLASVQLAADSTDTISTPRSLSEGTDLSIVAKNQLAVVRVGTIYCFDVDLLGQNGAAALSLDNVCGAGIGSGSIVRDDGMICTNGHVVKLGLREALNIKLQLFIAGKNEAGVKSVVDYLVGQGLFKSADAQKIITELMAANTEAIESISAVFGKMPDSRFKIKKEGGEYAIQLGNQPLRLNLTPEKLSFNYTDTVVAAKYIDAEVDSDLTTLQTSRLSDVALLDITDDRTFPVVRLGKMNSLRKGDQLTVMGFPGFVDGGILTKEKHTIPTATQGRITNLGSDAGGNKLVQATTMIAQGNSGGPAFNEDGEQIGLATYAALSAADPDIGKTKFSKEGVLRDVADFTELAAKHKVTFTGKSDINDDWYAAIDSLIASDYSKALTSLKAVEDAYGDHYLLASFIKASEDQLGIGLRRNLIIGAGAFLAIMLILGIVRLVKMLRRHSHPLPPTPMNLPPFVPPTA